MGIRPCYGMAPQLGRTQLHFLKHTCNNAISQVMERSCIELGMAQTDCSAFVGGLYHATPTPHFDSLYSALVQSLFALPR